MANFIIRSQQVWPHSPIVKALMCLKCAVSVIATVACMNATARSSPAVVEWMDEPRPFDAASIQRHFGDVLGAIQCADGPQGSECIADGAHVALRWRLNGDNREFVDGFLRMELEGCERKTDIEHVLGTTLRLEPQGVPERSSVVKLSGRRWSPGKEWSIDVEFDGECAISLTIVALPF